MKKTVALGLLSLLALFGWVPAARADGYVITEDTTTSWIMADQKAVIAFRDGREDLVISVGLNLTTGEDQKEMAWIIPVPSQPEVQAIDEEIFEVLDEISAPEVIYETVHQAPSWGLSASAPPPAVEVLERKQVGIYDVAVLSGEDAAALLTWLHDEGFDVPPALLAPLDAYIGEGWTFVAMRIAPGAGTGAIQNAQPVWLSFNSERLVYPMRLTGAHGQPLALRLYILADHRYELEGFGVEFAGQIEAQAPGTALASLMDGGFFFTKLFNPSVNPADMTVDFYPRQAAADESYREQIVHTHVITGMGGGPGFALLQLLCPCGLCWLGLVLMLALLLGTVALIKRRRKPEEP